MKKTIALILLLLPLMHAFAIRDTRNRDLKNFSAIVVEDCFEIHYTQSKEYRVYIDTLDGEILPRTLTVVQNDTLFITYHGNRLERVPMHVSSPALSYVNVSGMSTFIAEGNIKSQYADLFVSGTGSLKLGSLTTTFAHINKSGTGSFKMSGDLNCDSVIAEVEGAGKMELNNITSTIASISVTGACGCVVKGNVNVTTFTTSLEGVGSITLEGNITAKQNVWLELLGTGAVKAKGNITASLLIARQNGAGSISAPDIQVDRAEVLLKGVGTITLGGKAKEINKDITGMGKIKTDNLSVERSVGTGTSDLKTN